MLNFLKSFECGEQNHLLDALQLGKWKVGHTHGNSEGKLVDNFSHESDVTSLQNPFTSRPYKTPFYFYYCVPRKI